MNKLLLMVNLFLCTPSFLYCSDHSAASRDKTLTLYGTGTLEGSVEHAIKWNSNLSELFFGDATTMHWNISNVTLSDLKHTGEYLEYRAASEENKNLPDKVQAIEKAFFNYATQLKVEALGRVTVITGDVMLKNTETSPFPKGLEYPWMEKIVTGKLKDILLCTTLQQMPKRQAFLCQQAEAIDKKNKEHAALLKQGIVARLITPYTKSLTAQPGLPVFNFSLLNRNFAANVNHYRCSKPTHAYVDNNMRILMWDKKLVFVDITGNIETEHDISACGKLGKNCVLATDDGQLCVVYGDQSALLFVMATKKFLAFDGVKVCCFGKNKNTNCLYYLNNAGKLCKQAFGVGNESTSFFSEACDKVAFQGILHDHANERLIAWAGRYLYTGTFDEELELICRGCDVGPLDDSVKINNVIINPTGTQLCVEVCKKWDDGGNAFSYELIDVKLKGRRSVQGFLRDHASLMKFSPCGNFVILGSCNEYGNSRVYYIEVASLQTRLNDISGKIVGEYKTGFITVGDDGLFSYEVRKCEAVNQVMIDGINAIKPAQKYDPFTKDYSFEILKAVTKVVGNSGAQAREDVLDHFDENLSGATLSFDRQLVMLSDETRVLLPNGITLLLRGYDEAKNPEIKNDNHAWFYSMYKKLFMYYNKIGPAKVFGGGVVALMATMVGIYKLIRK